MLAAADYAEGEGNPPPELKLALSCEYWKCLPYGGGLLDQPAGLIGRMNLSRNVYDAFKAMKNSDNWAETAKDNPQMPDIIKQVEKLRRKQ
jgi:hypothetical protein